MLRATSHGRVNISEWRSIRHVGCILLLSLCGPASIAQHWSDEPGYIILNSGDTLNGSIGRQSAPFLSHHEITFKPKDEHKSYRFKPNELKGYRRKDEMFISHYVWSNEQLIKKFLKVIVKGYCTLYEYRYTTRSDRGMVSQPYRKYFVERPHEPLHEVDFPKLTSGKDKYFQDSVALTRDLLDGKYTLKDMTTIVTRYNTER